MNVGLVTIAVGGVAGVLILILWFVRGLFRPKEVYELEISEPVMEQEVIPPSETPTLEKTETANTRSLSNDAEEVTIDKVNGNGSKKKAKKVKARKTKKRRLRDTLDRKIMYLKKKGLSAKEIAKEVGVSTSTVYKRLKKKRRH
jgi:DNA-directed RNA polymerase specialized sigma subunit